MALEFMQAQKPSKPTVTGADYYIVPPEGGEPVRYARMTRFISVFAEKDNLVKRDMRYAVKGAAKYAEQIAELDIDDDRYEIDQIADRAAREAGKWYAADVGTCLHALTEDYDNGFLKPDFKGIPDTPAVSELSRGPMNMLVENHARFQKDLLAYATLMEAYDIRPVGIESTIVIDKYKVAGTTDRFSTIGNPMGMPVDDEAECSVIDVKSGSIDFGRREKAMQLAGYAIADLYNTHTHERTAHGASKKLGFIVHLPAGKAEASLIPVKLDRAIEYLELANKVQEIRGHKNVWKKFTADEWLEQQIDKAETEEDLKTLYFRTHPAWTSAHVERAKRKF